MRTAGRNGVMYQWHENQEIQHQKNEKIVSQTHGIFHHLTQAPRAPHMSSELTRRHLYLDKGHMVRASRSYKNELSKVQNSPSGTNRVSFTSCSIRWVTVGVTGGALSMFTTHCAVTPNKRPPGRYKLERAAEIAIWRESERLRAAQGPAAASTNRPKKVPFATALHLPHPTICDRPSPTSIQSPLS